MKTGALVWQFQTGSLGPWSPALGPGTGPAISYEIDGDQYLAFTIDRAIWAFKIGGPIGARPAPEPLPAVEPFRGAVRETDKITLAAMVSDTNPATGRRYEWKSEHAVSPVRAQAAAGTAVTWVNTGSLTHTISGIDIALWDLKARRAGLPPRCHPNVQHHPLVAMVEGPLRPPRRNKGIADLACRVGGKLVRHRKDRNTVDHKSLDHGCLA